MVGQLGAVRALLATRARAIRRPRGPPRLACDLCVLWGEPTGALEAARRPALADDLCVLWGEPTGALEAARRPALADDLCVLWGEPTGAQEAANSSRHRNVRRVAAILRSPIREPHP